MKSKTSKIVLVFLLFAIACSAAAYLLSYPIKLDMDTLPGYICNFYNNGRSFKSYPTIVLYDGVTAGSTEYYLLEIGEDLGTVTLKRGPTGRYKITRLSYGGGNFRDGIIEADGKRYFLFAGRDMFEQISKIAVVIGHQTYELEVTGSKDHFLLCTEIDGSVEKQYVSISGITLYNEAGEDITSLYDLSGGGIQA